MFNTCIIKTSGYFSADYQTEQSMLSSLTDLLDQHCKLNAMRDWHALRRPLRLAGPAIGKFRYRIAVVRMPADSCPDSARHCR
jgi:hypothetical protein